MQSTPTNLKSGAADVELDHALEAEVVLGAHPLLLGLELGLLLGQPLLALLQPRLELRALLVQRGLVALEQALHGRLLLVDELFHALGLLLELGDGTLRVLVEAGVGMLRMPLKLGVGALRVLLKLGVGFARKLLKAGRRLLRHPARRAQFPQLFSQLLD